MAANTRGRGAPKSLRAFNEGVNNLQANPQRRAAANDANDRVTRMLDQDLCVKILSPHSPDPALETFWNYLIFPCPRNILKLSHFLAFRPLTALFKLFKFYFLEVWRARPCCSDYRTIDCQHCPDHTSKCYSSIPRSWHWSSSSRCRQLRVERALTLIARLGNQINQAQAPLAARGAQ